MEKLVNRISKGLVSDIDNSIFPNDAAYEMKNCQITQLGNDFVITSLKGNKLEFSIPDNLTPIAFKEYNGIIYIISTKSSYTNDTVYEVGSYPSPNLTIAENTFTEVNDYVEIYNYKKDITLENQYKPLPASIIEIGGDKYILGFSSISVKFENYYCDILPRTSYDQTVDLFICNGENYNRAINNCFSDTELKVERLIKYDDFDRNIDVVTRQFLSVNKPTYCDYEVEKGGSLIYGRIFLYIRYLDISFNHTNWHPLCGPIQISYGNKFYDINGGNPEENIPTDKLINLTIDNVDDAFQYYEIAVFYERGLAGATPPIQRSYLIDKRYRINSDVENVIIDGFESQISITPEELQINGVIPEQISKSQSQLYNRWYGANFKKHDFNNDDIIEQFSRRCYVIPQWDYNYHKGIKISDYIKDKDDQYLINIDDDDLIRYQHYKYPPSNYPGEVCAYALVALFDDGTYSKPFPIRGFRNKDQWHGTPSNGYKKWNYETFVRYYSDVSGSFKKKMRTHLSATNSTKGLFQFPMLNTSNSNFSESLDNSSYPLGITLKLEYALEYFKENKDKFKDIKSFYLVRHDFKRNTEYMGIGVSAKPRFVTQEGYVQGLGEGYRKGKYLYYANNEEYTEYIGENGCLYNAYSTASYQLNYAYFVPNISYLYNVRPYTDLIPFNYDVYYLASEQKQKGWYGIFSEDIIFNSNRPLINNKNYIAKIGYENTSNHFTLIDSDSREKYMYPQNSNWINTSNSLLNGYQEGYNEFRNSITYTPNDESLYYDNYNCTIWNIETDSKRVGPFASEAGDRGFSDHSNLIFSDNTNVRIIDYKYTPYIGIKCYDPLFDNMICKDILHNNTIMLMHDNYEVIYNKIKDNLNDNFTLDYNVVSEYIELQDNGLAKSSKIEADEFHIYDGNCFRNRAYIKFKYNNTFNVKSGIKIIGEEYYSSSLFNVYSALSSQTITALLFSWNNACMTYEQNKYPFGGRTLEDRQRLQYGIRNEDELIGYASGLDASYNRHYFPNKHILLSDIYNEDENYEGRVRTTNRYIQESIIDAWRELPLSQYIDYDISLGEIIEIKNLLNNLFLFHKSGIYQVYSDRRESQQSTTGAELVIGTGSTLEPQRLRLTDKYGISQNGAIVIAENSLYGYDYDKNTIWQISANNSGFQVNDLSYHKLIQKKIIDNSENIKIDNVSGFHGSMLISGYSYRDKRVFFTAYDRKLSDDLSDLVTGYVIRIITIPIADYPELLYVNKVSGLVNGDKNTFYIEIGENDNFILSFAHQDKIKTVSLLLDNSFTIIFDEKSNCFYESTMSPNMYISGNILRSIKIDSNNTNDIYIHDDGNNLQFNSYNHLMELGIIVNGAGREDNLNSIQKRYDSSLIISDENEFEQINYITEFQNTELNPFIDDNRFWNNPEYNENKWEINIPVQENEDNNGYEEEAQMRGIWVKVLMRYRGLTQKYIKEIITRVTRSFS